MPASIPMRQGGTFTSRAAIRLRETFSRRTIVPFPSRPTMCSVFLPVSIPIVWTTAMSFLQGMACSSCSSNSPPKPTLSVVWGAKDQFQRTVYQCRRRLRTGAEHCRYGPGTCHCARQSVARYCCEPLLLFGIRAEPRGDTHRENSFTH
jgi:hypothetical protein